MGQQAAKDAEKQLSILNNRQATAYVDALGRQLAAHAPGDKYPFQYKIVNDKNINAFALPGGFIYINRGAIEAADNEAQLAGVIAHETGHVVLQAWNESSLEGIRCSGSPCCSGRGAWKQLGWFRARAAWWWIRHQLASSEVLPRRRTPGRPDRNADPLRRRFRPESHGPVLRKNPGREQRTLRGILQRPPES